MDDADPLRRRLRDALQVRPTSPRGPAQHRRLRPRDLPDARFICIHINISNMFYVCIYEIYQMPGENREDRLADLMGLLVSRNGESRDQLVDLMDLFVRKKSPILI